MSKLILKYEAAILKEVDVGATPVGIGRAPDNALHVDNLAVSSHHARIFNEAGKLVVEDMNSLNGTFVNSQRVTRATLKPGDIVTVGKHSIEVRGEAEAIPNAPGPAAPAKPAPPKLQETMVLDTKKRRELLAQAMAAGGAPADAAGGPGQAPGAPARARIPWLVVLAGKTDQHEYPLSNKLTVIGKSSMATVRLTGLFSFLAPGVAAQINKRDDGFYIGTGQKVPKVNGQPITGPTKLNEGDVIELGSVKLNFVHRD